MSKVLTLPIKKKWFDMILCGKKYFEYREVKEYWNIRLKEKPDLIRFVNGYGYERPYFIAECYNMDFGPGKPAWGGREDTVYHRLWLGDIIETGNIK